MTTAESRWHEVRQRGFDFADTDNYEDVFTSRPSASALVSEELEEDVTHHIIFAIFCVIGVCANLLIIYVILRFKNIRTVPYIYFVNWSFADLGTLTLTFIFNIIYTIEKSSISLIALCHFVNLTLLLKLATNLFVFATTIDWYISVYSKSSSETYRKTYHKYIIAAVWLLTVILICTNIGLCTGDNTDIIGAAILLALLSRWYYLTFVLILVIQVKRAFEKCKKQLPEDSAVMLTLATFFIVMYLVLDSTGALFILQVIVECVGLCLSVFNVGLLSWLDKDFKICFLKVVKCSKTADNTPEVDKTTEINKDEYFTSVYNPAEAESLNKV